MTKITEYFILSTESIQRMTDLVDAEIKNGYQPFGALSVLAQGETIIFYQAMVKYSS